MATASSLGAGPELADDVLGWGGVNGAEKSIGSIQGITDSMQGNTEDYRGILTWITHVFQHPVHRWLYT